MLMFAVRPTPEFVEWLDSLSDRRARIRIVARLRQVEAGNLGDWRPIEGPLAEVRVHFGAGYQLYFMRQGAVIIVLLNAGDKSSQRRDIGRAMELAQQIGEES